MTRIEANMAIDKAYRTLGFDQKQNIFRANLEDLGVKLQMGTITEFKEIKQALTVYAHVNYTEALVTAEKALENQARSTSRPTVNVLEYLGLISGRAILRVEKHYRLGKNVEIQTSRVSHIIFDLIEGHTIVTANTDYHVSVAVMKAEEILTIANWKQSLEEGNDVRFTKRPLTPSGEITQRLED
ncbi:hypothetical protein KAR91_83750 [Candidatus Pacearchaeota archaeon]|nr:hypothetical protein [Candidatus Pacearchaeota archaeon]